MTRNELVRLLALLVRQGKLSVAQAQQIMAQFDDGDITSDSLPLPLAETQPKDSETAAALLAVGLLLGGLYASRLRSGKFIPRSAKEKARDRLRERFDVAAKQAVSAAASGQIA